MSIDDTFFGFGLKPPAEGSGFDFYERPRFWMQKVPVTGKPAVDDFNEYWRSAMTSKSIKEASGMEPVKKPVLEWRTTVYTGSIEVELIADGRRVRDALIRCRHAEEWSPRYTRKMERKIEAAKASLMRAYLLCQRSSGPVVKL